MRWLSRETTRLFSVGYVSEKALGIVLTMHLDGATVSREEKQTAAPENRVSRPFPVLNLVFST